jgi:ABC-type transporter Mla subunit MlaD
MGPRLDDQTLGMLGPTEFFGELSLLPIEGGWNHRRTAMVVQNSMLHTLSSADVQSVSDRFPELRHRLVDHAEDYQRVQAAAAAAADIENLSAIKAKKVRTGRAAVSENQDPLAIVKAQLSQQEAKLEQISALQDAKLEQVSGTANALTQQAAWICHTSPQLLCVRVCVGC